MQLPDNLDWLEKIKGAKPSTMRNHRSTLAEPGTAYRRGRETINGHVMAALGDRPASKITTREINALLTKVSDTGASSSAVNRSLSSRLRHRRFATSRHRLSGSSLRCPQSDRGEQKPVASQPAA